MMVPIYIIRCRDENMSAFVKKIEKVDVFLKKSAEKLARYTETHYFCSVLLRWYTITERILTKDRKVN